MMSFHVKVFFLNFFLGKNLKNGHWVKSGPWKKKSELEILSPKCDLPYVDKVSWDM